MLAADFLQSYKDKYKVNKIGDISHFKNWAETTLKKRMPRPLFIAVGKGGGQTYKTLWEVFDSRYNNNTPSYFYNENQRAINELLECSHLELQDWIDDTSPHLQFTP